MTEVGKRTVMLDGAGRPCAVLVTLELVQRRFEGADAAFAFKKAKVIERLHIGGNHTATTSVRRTDLPRTCYCCERFRVVETIAGVEGP
jgi:uncharacterized protein YhfF